MKRSGCATINRSAVNRSFAKQLPDIVAVLRSSSKPLHSRTQSSANPTTAGGRFASEGINEYRFKCKRPTIMTMPERERIADTRAHTGEGRYGTPTIDDCTGSTFRPANSTDTTRTRRVRTRLRDRRRPARRVHDREDGALLLFTHGTVSRLEPGDDIAQPVVEIDAETRFNDVIADPEGRVFCGTMPGDDELGDLYRLEPDGTATVVIENIDIPNGMGFSRNLETFYLTESEAHAVYAFDYDRETGALTNRRTFLETGDGDGVPDGMTVDADDYVWSARWDGGRVVRYKPDGRDVDTIDLPHGRSPRLRSGTNVRGPVPDDRAHRRRPRNGRRGRRRGVSGPRRRRERGTGVSVADRPRVTRPVVHAAIWRCNSETNQIYTITPPGVDCRDDSDHTTAFDPAVQAGQSTLVPRRSRAENIGVSARRPYLESARRDDVVADGRAFVHRQE